MSIRLTTSFALAAGLWCAAVAAQALAGDAPENGRSWMGVILGDAIDGGVQLVAVVPEGPAELAGMKVGDVVVQAGNLRLLEVADLTRLLEEAGPGTELEFQLLRSGRALQRKVRLGDRPAPSVLFPSFRPVRPASVFAGPPSPPRPPTRRYGWTLAEMSPDLRRHFGGPPDAGLLVTRIEPGTAAAEAGIRVGDLVVRLEETPVRDVREVERAIADAVDGAIRASLIRSGRPTDVTVRAGSPPVAPPAPAPGTDVRFVPAPTVPRSDAKSALDRAVAIEIERLERRIEELKRLLPEQEDDEPPER